MPPNEDTDTIPDESLEPNPSIMFERRSLLQVIGLGAGLSLGSGVAVAQADESGQDTTEDESDGPEGTGFPPDHLTDWGDPVDVGEGEAKTFVTINSADQPLLVGLQFTADALAGLDNDEHEHFPLEFPDAIDQTAFEWLGLDWEPHGHGPPRVYDVPHFDIHFYLMPEDEVNEIPAINFPPGEEKDDPYTVPLPDDQFPPNHIRDHSVVPQMGEHLPDVTAPAWSGGELTNSFIWGHWEGELNFFEPMLTPAYLENLNEQETREISMPERFPEAGRYPTEYTVRYHEDEDTYTVTLESFTLFEASEGIDNSQDDDGDDTSDDEISESEYVDEIDGQVERIYGEQAVLSNGVIVIAHGVTIEEELGGEEPEERDAFALVEIEAVNDGEEEARLPEQTDPGVELLFGDQQVGPTFRYGAFRESDYEQYESDHVQPGVRREGHILYEVDAGFSEDDIDFLWQDDYFVASDLDGVINVRWTADN